MYLQMASLFMAEPLRATAGTMLKGAGRCWKADSDAVHNSTSSRLWWGCNCARWHTWSWFVGVPRNAVPSV